ncbi:MAG: hypothetical protein L3J63_04390 [Geopsychrobacter sp.]|nr:hypothetical protein [Geopsychrobacter sp.]
MKIKKLVFFALLSFAIPGMAFGSDSDWLQPQQNLYFDISPSNFAENLSENDKVIWFGEIEDVSAYVSNNNETIIEYNCRHLIYSEDNSDTAIAPYRVKKQETDFFIFSIKAPEMSAEEAISLSNNIENSAKIAIIKGVPYKKIDSADKNIVYINSEQIITTDKSIVTIVE